MRKYNLTLILILVLVASLLLINVNAKGQEFNKVEKKVIEELSKEGKAKVIVVMKEKDNKKNSLSSAQKNNIRMSVKEKIGEEKVKHEFIYSNAFSAALTM